MAKPPEPIEEVMPQAALVVVGSVKQVVSRGADLPPLPKRDEPASDVGARSPEQQLVLTVEKVLRGKLEPGAELRVTKPIAAYAVKEGTKGAWLVDDNGVVLGRYGPDSWRLSDVEWAVKQPPRTK